MLLSVFSEYQTVELVRKQSWMKVRAMVDTILLPNKNPAVLIIFLALQMHFLDNSGKPR
jgi:hypothetical protein